MGKLRTVLGICLVPLLAACQSTSLWLANVPTNFNMEMETKRNLSYGDATWQRLDVYFPASLHADTPNEDATIAEADYRSFPVIVFYHGGGWESGRKEQYRFIADRLVSQGYVVVIPDYVKYPEARYPAFVEDAATVTHWLKRHIATYKGDPNNMHIIGHSAGAHIGAMLLTDRNFLAYYDLHPSDYRSFVGLAGPYNFTPGLEKYKTIFGPESNYPNMQASNFVKGGEPPMFLAHGARDVIVTQDNMEKLAASIEEVNGEVRTRLYQEYDHINILGAFSRSFSPITGSNIVDDTLAWLRQKSR